MLLTCAIGEMSVGKGTASGGNAIVSKQSGQYEKLYLPSKIKLAFLLMRQIFLEIHLLTALDNFISARETKFSKNIFVDNAVSIEKVFCH